MISGSGHISIFLDVTKLEDVENVFKVIIAEYNEPPTIILNCAGILLFHPFLEETETIFESQIDINIKVRCLTYQLLDLYIFISNFKIFL